MVKGATIKLSAGESLRFGPDEPFDVPTQISWDTEMPGGFGPGQMTVPLPESLGKDDQLLYADVRVYGPGNRTLAEGYITGTPRSSPGLVTIQWAGHSTLLGRFENFRAIVVDRSFDRWEDPPLQLRADALNSGATNIEGPTSDMDDAGSPTLRLTRPNTGAAARSYAIYRGGMPVRRIQYSYKSRARATAVCDISITETDAGGASGGATGDLIATANQSGAGTLTASTAYRYARARFQSDPVPAAEEYVAFDALAVYGDHNIPLRGPAPQGVYASDVIAHIIDRTPLNAILGETIEETTWIIPQLAWHEDVTMQQAIEEITEFGGSQLVRNDWGVYEDREFFWRSPGTHGRVWHVRREQLADRQSDGPDVDLRAAGMKVLWEDAAGQPRSVGPPGSNSDDETRDLLDIDDANPAHRVPGMFQTVEAGVLAASPSGVPQAAINVGIVALNSRNRLFWRGSLELAGTVEDQHGNPYPAALVRAGDRIVITDDPDPTELPIGSTSYTDDTESVTVSVGALPDTEETMLTQLAATADLIPG